MKIKFHIPNFPIFKFSLLFLLCLVLLLGGFSGCATIEHKPTSLTPVKKSPKSKRESANKTTAPAKEEKTEIAAPHPPSEDILDEEIAELPSISVKTPYEEYESRRYDFDLQSGNITDVLRALVKGSDIGLVIEPGISSGVIPIMDLKNATLKEILSYILPPLKLRYKWEGKNLHIFKDPLVTRYFNLNYHSSLRKGKRQVSFSTRSGSTSGGGGGGGGGGSGSSGSSGGGSDGGAGGGGGGQNQSSTQITTEYQNSLWSTFSESLKVLVFGALQGEGEAGEPSSAATEASGEKVKAYSFAAKSGKRLIVSPETGIVVVTAYEHEVNRVATFIEKFEGSSQRQVWIEAKIVEVDLNNAFQMGIDWGAVANRGGYYGTLDNKRTLSSPAMSFTAGSVENQALSSANSGTFQFAVSNNILDFMLDGISRQGNLKVLASPRISTLNNEKAVIRVVREEVFFNLQTQISQGIGGNVAAPTINVQVVPVGIIMDIVPQISDDGDILLSINPDISELLEIRRFEVEGALSTQPVIDRRSIDTMAKIKDGQTLVIAGIIKERKSETVKGVPFLHKIPLLGSLFRRTEQSVERTELIIFITPRLHSGKSADQLTEAERQRLKDAIFPTHLGDVFPLKDAVEGETSSFKKKVKKDNF